MCMSVNEQQQSDPRLIQMMSQLQSTMLTVVEGMQQIQKDVQQLQKEVHQLQRDVRKLQGEVSELQKAVVRLEHRVTTLEIRMDTLENRVDVLETTVKHHHDESATAHKQIIGTLDEAMQLISDQMQDDKVRTSVQFANHETRLQGLEKIIL